MFERLVIQLLLIIIRGFFTESRYPSWQATLAEADTLVENHKASEKAYQEYLKQKDQVPTSRSAI
jgi:hypothetical protein